MRRMMVLDDSEKDGIDVKSKFFIDRVGNTILKFFILSVVSTISADYQ